MSNIKPGIYSFSDPTATNHICGRAYRGKIEVTASLAHDEYVGRLVDSGFMKYASALPAQAPPVMQPKLISREPVAPVAVAGPEPEPEPEPEASADRPFQTGGKGKDRK